MAHTTGIGGGRDIPRVKYNTACRWPIGLLGTNGNVDLPLSKAHRPFAGAVRTVGFFFFFRNLWSPRIRHDGEVDARALTTTTATAKLRTRYRHAARGCRVPTRARVVTRRCRRRQSALSSSSSSSAIGRRGIARRRAVRDPSAPRTNPRPDPFFPTLARTRSHTAAQSILPKVKTPTRCVCTRATAASSPLRCSKKNLWPPPRRRRPRQYNCDTI